jgi:signal transduction histidine kinase
VAPARGTATAQVQHGRAEHDQVHQRRARQQYRTGRAPAQQVASHQARAEYHPETRLAGHDHGHEWIDVKPHATRLAGTALGPHRTRAASRAAATKRANAAQAARIAELDRQAAIGAERARMARDLHDVVAGHLSAIAIQSKAVMSMADTDPATARTVLRSVRENSVRSLEEMQTMIGPLRADGVPDPPIAPARLADLDPLLCSARAGGLRVAADLPVAVDLAAYRIVQEALTNAAKHAAGSRTSVAVHRKDAEVVVEIINELTAPVTDREGTGLVSMCERAHATGGTLAAGRCGSSWRVRAVLPTGGAGTLRSGCWSPTTTPRSASAW